MRFDAGKGVRRAHKMRRQDTGGVHIVAEAALPAQQRVILDAAGPGGWLGAARGGRLIHEGLRQKKITACGP
jgi:hypothetical protein